MRIGTQCSLLGVFVSSLIFVACGGGGSSGDGRGNAGGSSTPQGGGGGGGNNTSTSGNTGNGMGGGIGIGIGNASDCGNRMLDPNEQCDDGNNAGNDGCSKSCQIEADYVCGNPGELCKSTAACGNGILTSSETCDDGNTASGDGCSADCKTVEDGWACRVPGKACVPNCGDGKMMMGKEKCDDGNTMNGDGCSSTCLIEPGWSCDDQGKNCVKSVCGNGMKEAGESCDKGMAENGHFYGDGSGCSKTCTQEPTCRDSMGVTQACTTRCGDSNIDPDEKCDDGNQVDGDGCSSKCQEEGGFTCMTVTKPDTTPCSMGGGQCLVLPITYRDFDGANAATGHPDFFYYGATVGGAKTTCVPNASGANLVAAAPGAGVTCPVTDATNPCPGLVKATLGADGKPALGSTATCKCTFTDWGGTGILTSGLANTRTCASGGSESPLTIENVSVKVIQSADSFKQWYTDSDKSTKFNSTLELAQIGAGNQYQFSSSNGRTVYDDLHDIWLASKNYPVPAGAANSLSSGFFPLEMSTRPKLCNLWPYWNAPASCVSKQWDSRGWNNGTATGPSDGKYGSEVPTANGMQRNFYFTSEVRYLFRYQGGETLAFFGDDDVWVFINGHLALDLGAPHERMKGQLSLTDTGAAWTLSVQSQTTGMDVALPAAMGGAGTVTGLGLEKNKTYEIAIFHADRHPRESNYQLTLSGYSTSTSQCMARCGDNVATAGEECDLGDMNADDVYGGCSKQCKFGPFCGDNMKNGPEECDKGKDNGGAYGTKGGCTLGCKNTHFCGDGIVDAVNGEECDAGTNNAPGATCNEICHYTPK